MAMAFLRGGEATSSSMTPRATGVDPAFRDTLPSSVTPALPGAVQKVSNEVEPVAPSSPEIPEEPEISLQENWLFVLPLAMFVLLGTFAAIMIGT
jgi:hypothetical protein